jgi:hypothetical protein
MISSSRWASASISASEGARRGVTATFPLDLAGRAAHLLKIYLREQGKTGG